MPEKTIIKYHPISELNENYLIEYCPPNESTKLANLQLIIRKECEAEEVAKYVEAESRRWSEKYPITTMAAAYNENEDVFDLTSVRASSHFMVYFDENRRKLSESWGFADEPKDTYYPSADSWNYFDKLRYTKTIDPDKIHKTQRNRARLLKFVAILWALVLPALYEIYMFAGPEWVSIIAFIYALFKIVTAGLKAIGVMPHSRIDRETRTLQIKKDHYFYHCELNPKGFARLKSENIDNDAIKNTRAAIRKLERQSSLNLKDETNSSPATKG